jgi:hypothetical protein
MTLPSSRPSSTIDIQPLRAGRRKEKYEVKLQIQPKVHLQARKGCEGELELGQDRGTYSRQDGTLWSATAADNSFGVLAEYGRRGHQRIHSHEVHGGKGGLAGK